MTEEQTQSDDTLDRQLFESGDIAALLARYWPMIRSRCIAGLSGRPQWEDVAQNVRVRLLDEFRRGKRYPVPYRVVVGNVIRWTINDHFQGRPTDVPLPDGWDVTGRDDESEAVLSRDWLEWLFGELPEREHQVAEARYLHLLEPDQIAAELDIERNNVDQILYRLHKRLREGGGFG